jgi:hypothetical protein
MRPRRAFRPAEVQSLEQRATPSSFSLSPATVHAERTLRTVAVTFTGLAKVTPSTLPGAPETIHLGGTAKYVGLFKMSLTGPLSVNLTATPGTSGISGTLHLSSKLGSADLVFAGPQTDLIPTKTTSISVTYTVQHGSGLFANAGNQSTILYLKPPRKDVEAFRIGIHN